MNGQEHPIADLSKYNERMNRSLIDKMFFFDKVDAESFVDVGCADGSLILFFAKIFPENHYLGYDNDPKMIDAANSKLADAKLTNVEFTSEFSKAQWWVLQQHDAEPCRNVCMTLLSVIHEVYSYGPEQVDQFWSNVWSMGADYVAIRDMCVSQTASRPADPISVARVRQVFDPNKIAQWESQWGALDENWSLIHFFLTYSYEDNWEREYRENYLPINKERLLALMPCKYPNNFVPDFIEHYTLPYLRRKVERYFGIQLQERTHIKLILRKNSY